MGKNNLDSINIKRENILPEEVGKKRKNKKPENERETETIAMKITPKEMSILKDKVMEAGELVRLSTFIKHYIRTKTDLFIKNDMNEN